MTGPGRGFLSHTAQEPCRPRPSALASFAGRGLGVFDVGVNLATAHDGYGCRSVSILAQLVGDQD